MKPLILIAALALCGCEARANEPITNVLWITVRATNYANPVTNVFNLTVSKPYWRLETNWDAADYGLRGIDFRHAAQYGNSTTYLERGVVMSNLVTWVQYGDSINWITLRSVPVTAVERTYRFNTTKEYLP